MLFGKWPVGADLHCFQGNKLVSPYLSTVAVSKEVGGIEGGGGEGKSGERREH